MRWLWIFSRPNMHMCLIIMMRENEDPIILDHLTIGAWELREHRAKAAERRVDAYSHISFRWHCKFFVIQVFFLAKIRPCLCAYIYIEKADHSYQKPHSETACTPAGYFFKKNKMCSFHYTDNTHALFHHFLFALFATNRHGNVSLRWQCQHQTYFLWSCVNLDCAATPIW